MKFSFSAAYGYLKDTYVREKFSKLHESEMRRKMDGSGRLILPPSALKMLDRAGLLQQIIDKPAMKDWSPELTAAMLSEPKKIFLDVNNVKVYLIRKTVQEICSKINVREEKKFDYLNKISDGNKILVIDEKRFYKYYKDNERIVVCYFEQGDLYNYTMFNFELQDRYVGKADRPEMELIEERFIQFLMFLEFAPYEQVFLKPNEKDGTRKEGKVINDSNYGIIVVDSDWNKVVIRTDGFTVGAETGGFLALRAYGAGRQGRRFVWISPFEKHGYTRGVDKDKLFDTNENKDYESERS